LEAKWSQLMTLLSASTVAKPLDRRTGAGLFSVTQLWSGRSARGNLPDLLLTSMVAATSFAIRMLPGMANFSPVVLSMLVGIAYHNVALIRTAAGLQTDIGEPASRGFRSARGAFALFISTAFSFTLIKLTG
jgi:hypothetical protein